jgi:hypothetical protein
MTTAADAKPVAMSAPVDLATIKDDLGIPADDTSNDAWLQRRIDGIWSRFQAYTGRPLQLASTWADDWGLLITNHPAYTQPPLWRAMPSATVFLRMFPVQAVSKLVLSGQEHDPARLLIELGSGKLIGLEGYASDLRTALVTGQALVEYEAGFDELPPDLYEALLGALTAQWTARQAAAGGVAPGGLMPTRINATDVGEIELSSASNFFVDQAGRRDASDPLLGPYAMILDPYVDWRSITGGAYPSTSAVDREPTP